MKKKLELRKETVAMLDGMGEVRGGGTVLVSYQSNCPMCPTQVTACGQTCLLTCQAACEDPKPVSLGQPCILSNMPESCPCQITGEPESRCCIRETVLC